jgi:hypothetical protein
VKCEKENKREISNGALVEKHFMRRPLVKKEQASLKMEVAQHRIGMVFWCWQC